MQLESYLSKTQFWFTQIGFLVLAVLALVFADERLLADSSYYFIRVINAKGFWIEHNRLILALSQIPVVLGTWLGLKMKWLITLYSIWHVLFFYGIHLIAKHRYQSRTSGPTLVLLMSVGLTSGFFVPMFELYYAAALIILFDAILDGGKRSFLEYLTLTVLALFITSAHFMAVVLLGVVIAFHVIGHGVSNLKYLVLPAIAVIAVMAFKKFHISDYEQGKIDWFLNGLQNFSISPEYLNALGRFLVVNYLDFLFILAIALVVVISNKKWKESIMLVASVLVLTMMVTISDPWFESNRYQEQVYFPLMFAAVFALVKFGFGSRNMWLKTTAIIIAMASFGHRASDIWSEGKLFQSRLAELKHIIAQTQDLSGTKFVVEKNALTYEPNWSYPIESLIFSSAEYSKTVTICTNVDYEHNENHEVIQPDQFLFRRWEICDLNELNSEYFELDISDYGEL